MLKVRRGRIPTAPCTECAHFLHKIWVPQRGQVTTPPGRAPHTPVHSFVIIVCDGLLAALWLGCNGSSRGDGQVATGPSTLKVMV
jgi:hypothetical protein